MIHTIELHRQFVPLTTKVEGDFGDWIRLARGFGGHLKSWDDLLSEPFVVVLGEAGSGKTTEFRSQVTRLAAAGTPAFFVRLEELAAESVRESLEGEAELRFSEWLEGTERALLFLDALDESKLVRLELPLALKKIRRELNSAAVRAGIIVSCRVSDWDMLADLESLKAHARAVQDVQGNDTQELAIHPLVVGIAPLDTNQFRTLAVHRGATKVDDLLHAIQAADAEFVVERPADVDWIVTYWNAKGGLGALRDILAFNVQQKLRETRSRRERTLSPEAALNGCRRLAGAATLTGHLSFSVASLGINEQVDGSIDPSTVLHDWQPKEVAELLELPIFDESTYGRVRFHHRLVQEWLAADWLWNLMERGASKRAISRLLFPRPVDGFHSIVPKHLQETAAWISLKCLWVRTQLAAIAPETLMAYGDPSGITKDEKASILSQYLNRFRGRRRTFHSFSDSALRRFASPDLEATIRNNVADRSLSEEVRDALLVIAKEAGLRELGALVVDIATDRSESVRIRHAAIRAAGAIANPDDQGRLLDGLLTENLDHDVAGAVLEVFFPDRLSSADLIRIIRTTAMAPESTVTSLKWFLEYSLGERLGRSAKEQLLDAMLDLLLDDTGRHEWLIPTVVNLLRGAVEDTADGAQLSASVQRALDYFEKCKQDRHADILGAIDDVEEMLKGRPDTRKRMFWAKVDAFEGNPARRATRYHDVVEWYWLIEFGAEDLDWLAADAENAADDAKRVLAFDTLLWARCDERSNKLRWERARALADKHELFARHLTRVGNARSEDHHEMQRYHRQNKALDQRREKQKAVTMQQLTESIEQIRSGEHQSALLHLAEVGRTSLDHYGQFAEDKVAENYSQKIATSAREGLKACWAKLSVPTPAEWAVSGQIPTVMMLGLSGISVAVEDGLATETLSAEQQEVAVRLATWEINGVPDWLEGIAKTRPDLIREIFGPTLQQDLRADATQARNLKLHELERKPWLREILVPELVVALGSVEPGQLGALRSRIQCLGQCHAETIHPVVCALRNRCERLTEDLERRAIWLAFWLNESGLAAAAYLLEALEKVGLDDQRELLEGVLQEIWEMGDRHRTAAPLKLHRNGAVLEQLTPISFELIRPADDIQHSGVFSPSRRDNAQSVRDRLIPWLVALPPEEALERLHRLSNHPKLTEISDYLKWQIELCLSRHESHAPWSSEKLQEWTRDFVFVPRNSRDLFRCVLDVLEDVIADVENGDMSNKKLFNPEEPIQEFFVQRHLMRELNSGAKGRFTVAAEEQIGDDNYPDIRAANPAVDGKIALEMKIAERWSYSALSKAVDDQLAARYLRDPTSKHGVLVLASSGPKKTWQKDTNTRLDFVQLLKELQLEADRIREVRGLDAVRIVGVDFH